MRADTPREKLSSMDWGFPIPTPRELAKAFSGKIERTDWQSWVLRSVSAVWLDLSDDARVVAFVTAMTTLKQQPELA